MGTTTRRLSLLTAALALALLCQHTASAGSDDFAELEGVRCEKPSSRRTEDANSAELCREMCEDRSGCAGATYDSDEDECMTYTRCNEYDLASDDYTSFVKNFDMIKGGVECDNDKRPVKTKANGPESKDDDGNWVGPNQISFRQCVEACKGLDGCEGLVYTEKTEHKDGKPRSRQFICNLYEENDCDKYEKPDNGSGVVQRTSVMAKTGDPSR